jgi:hypothetical protein
MWWPQPTWYEAHNAPATTVTGAHWVMAGGLAGGPTAAETFVLIANADTAAATATVLVSFEDGSSVSTGVTLPAQSRTNVPIGATFPQAAGRRFAVEVIGSGAGRLVVERATYESPGGVLWAAGSAGVATRLVP